MVELQTDTLQGYQMLPADCWKLKEEDVKVVAACSHRMVEETIDADNNSVKSSKFVFIQFREY